MNRTSWIIDSQRFAKKIKNASGTLDPSKQKWVSNPTMECKKCGHIMDNSDVVQPWPGLPLGVKFDPSEQELLLHLLAKHGKEGRKPHPFIEEFIPTLEEEDGICYTHPHKLPGVKQDGSISHFFHRTFKAYNTGTRKRRKINTGNLGDVRWHKTGNTKPVLVDGKRLGCKKILVLYMSPVKGGKAEKTNWVMHQYHLGTGEDEKDGEYVVSKLFYQYKPGKKTTQESAATDGVDSVAEADIPDLPPLPSEEDIGTNEVVVRGPEHNPYEVNGTFEINIEGNAVEETAALLLSEKPEDPEVAVSLSEKPEDPEVALPTSEKPGDPEVALPTSEKPGDPELPQSQDLKLWEGDSQQFELLDSQQLAEGMALCDEFLLSQSQASCGDGDGDKPKPIKPRLAVYAQLPAEDLKKDLEECQKMVKPLDNTSLDLDGGNEFRLSQIEFSQDSFSAWGAGGKMIDD